MTPAQRRRARKKAGRMARRERLAINQAVQDKADEAEREMMSPRDEAGAQMAMIAAEKLKAKFARKKEGTGNAGD